MKLQVCELDIIFNFEKAYFILDELLIGGEMQETSKKNVLKAIAAQDVLQEVSTPEDHYDLWVENHRFAYDYYRIAFEWISFGHVLLYLCYATVIL